MQSDPKHGEELFNIRHFKTSVRLSHELGEMENITSNHRTVKRLFFKGQASNCMSSLSRFLPVSSPISFNR